MPFPSAGNSLGTWRYTQHITALPRVLAFLTEKWGEKKKQQHTMGTSRQFQVFLTGSLVLCSNENLAALAARPADLVHRVHPSLSPSRPPQPNQCCCVTPECLAVAVRFALFPRSLFKHTVTRRQANRGARGSPRASLTLDLRPPNPPKLLEFQELHLTLS